MAGPVINLGVSPEALAAAGEWSQAAKAQMPIVKQLENAVRNVGAMSAEEQKKIERSLTQAYKDLDRYKQAARSAKEIQRDAQSAIGRTTTTGERSSFTSGPQMVNTFSQEERYRFKKQFDEEVGRLKSGAEAAARGISARGLSRGPEELISLLQGGISFRSLHGLTESAQFVAQENGLKGIAGLAQKAGGIVGTLAAGLMPTALIAEIANGIIESAVSSATGQSGKTRQESLVAAFKGDNPFETETEQKRRIAKIGQILGRGIRVSTAGTSLQGGSQFEKALRLENRLGQEFQDHILRLQKDPKSRVYLQQQFGQKAFSNPEEEVLDTFQNMLERGDDAGEMLGKVRRARGELDAQELHQKQADWLTKRSPLIMAEYRNIEQRGRVLEEMIIEQHQQWNEE